jgi:flagellar basal-body rod protein FlgG
MTTLLRKMDVTADNIANANSTGFKKDRVATRSFTEELLKRLDDPGDQPYHDVPIGRVSQGLFIDDIYTDFSGGGFRKSSAPLDLAIEGSGFFCVSHADNAGQSSEMYTRDGSFTLGGDGLLLTKEGNPVLGANGMIMIPPGHITVNNDGSIFSNDEYVDKLKIADFADTHELRKRENNLFAATNRAIQRDFTGEVHSGFLENSNVSSIREMTDMIVTSRAFEANQRMITIHDTILNRAANDIGKKV